MRLSMMAATLGLGAALFAAASPPAFAAAASPQAQSCRERAQTDGKGKPDFYAKCMEGAQAPDTRGARPSSLGEQAIVAPSGSTRTTRSNQCSTEADRRGLQSGERDNFRRACLATAAPVSAVGIAGQATRPTPERSDLGGLTAAPRQGQEKATSAGAQKAPR